MVLRRACTALLCHRWRVLHCLQALWGFKSPLRPFPRLPLSNGAPWFSVSLRCQQDLNQPPSFLLFFLSLPPASLVQHILSSLFGLMIATLGHSESLPKPVSTSPFVIWILFSCLRSCLAPPPLFSNLSLSELLRQKCYKGGWFVTIASVFSQLAGSDRAFVWWPNIFFVESLCPITLISYCNCLTCMACNRCALFRPLPLKQKNRRWQLLNY